MGLRSRVKQFFEERRDADQSWMRPVAGPFPFGGTDSQGNPVVSFTPQLIEALRFDGVPLALTEIYRTQSAVRTCVNFLALNIAHLNLKTYRRGADGAAPEEVSEHPLARLIQQPNSRTSRFDMMRGTVSDLAIFDNAYWWKNFIGNARSLFRVPPIYIQPKGGNVFSGPSYYTIGTGEGPKDVGPEDIVHFRGYNSVDTRVGSSILEALRNVIAEETAASAHRRGYFRNAARAEGWLERPSEAGTMSKEAFERLRESVQNVYSGASNAGKIGILEEGTKFNPAGFSPKDSEFIAGREWALDTVATAYQIPLAVLSRKQTATFASMKEFHKALYVDTLGPWNAMIEDTLALQLIPDFDDPALFVEFNISEKLQGDFESTADAFRSAVQVPYMPVNTALKLQNIPPIGDPNDPDNPFNYPARPTAYSYVASASELPAPPAPVPNGQATLGVEDLERLLET